MTDMEIYDLEVWLLENVFGWKRDKGNVGPKDEQVPGWWHRVQGEGHGMSTYTTNKPYILFSPKWILALQKKVIQKLPLSLEISFNGTNWFFERCDGDSAEAVVSEDFGLGLGLFAKKVFSL